MDSCSLVSGRAEMGGGTGFRPDPPPSHDPYLLNTIRTGQSQEKNQPLLRGGGLAPEERRQDASPASRLASRASIASLAVCPLAHALRAS